MRNDESYSYLRSGSPLLKEERPIPELQGADSVKVRDLGLTTEIFTVRVYRLVSPSSRY